MLKSFKRVLLRRKYSSNTFEKTKHNDFRRGWISRADPRSTSFTHQHVLRVLDPETKATTISEACFKAELITLTNSPTSISKEKLENILSSLFANGCIDQLFKQVAGILRHELLDLEPGDRVELMEALIQKLDEHDIYHYNELLLIYLDNNKDFSPAEFLNNLYNQNIEPNDRTKYLIFKYYCLKGMIDKANKIMSEIQDNNTKSSLKKICADLILAHRKPRYPEQISCIIDSMKEENIVRDFNGHAILMCICAMRNDIESIKYIHNLCISKSVNISTIDASRVLYILKTYGYQSSIPEVFNIFTLTLNGQHTFHLILQLLSLGQEEFAIESWVKYINNVWTAKIIEDVYKYIFFRRLFRNTCDLKQTHKLTAKKCKGYDMLARFQVLDGFHKDRDLVKYKSYIGILLKENEYSLKSLHFWPLLAKCNKDMDVHGIFCIIDFMINECGIQPCFDTLKEFIIPYMIRNNYFINILRYLRVEENTINNAIAYTLLRQYRPKKMYQYLVLNESTYYYSLLSKPLLDVFVFTRDIYTFIKITKFLKDVYKHDNLNASNCEKNMSIVSMDEYILQIRQNFPKEQHLLQRLCEELRHQGITLSQQENKMSTECGLQLKLEPKRMSSKSINEHGMNSRLIGELNDALRHFCVNGESFMPITRSSDGIVQLIKKLQELIQLNASMLQFLQKYYTLTNSTVVESALEKCHNTYIQDKRMLNPIINLLEKERIRESLLKIRDCRWTIIKLRKEQQLQHTDQLTQSLIRVLKRYGPMAVLSILEYMSSKYHFLPHGASELIPEFQKFGSDEFFRKFIGIYKKLDRQRCYSDLLFYYLKHNRLEDAVETMKKLDIYSEHFELRVKEAWQQADAPVVNLLRRASLHLSVEGRDSSISKLLDEVKKDLCKINIEPDHDSCKEIAYSVK